MKRLFPLLVVLTLAACAKDRVMSADPPTTSPAVVPAPVAPSASAGGSAASAPLRLGEPISAGVVALTDVAAHPASFRGKTIATSGTVTAVCQEMGCWMEIRDDRGLAHIRMHGHSFFVPKTASGHHARVQATLVDAKDATECEDETRGDAGKALTKLDLDATGVELD